MFWLIKGFRLIFSPSLKRYSFTPIFINILFFCVLYGLAGYLLAHWVGHLNASLPHWLQWLDVVLWVLFVVLAIVLLGFCFGVLVGVFGAPFYGFLSAKVQGQLGGPKAPEESLYQLAVSIPQGLVRQVKLLSTYALPAIFVLIISFIPVIQGVSVFLWFLMGAKFSALQTMDALFQANGKSFEETKQFYRHHRVSMFSFGAMTMLLLCVPVLNWFVVPAAIAGATAWYCEKSW